MTNKEAATWLREHFDVTPDGTKQSEAIDMAIEALEQQPCEDCISRAEALKHSHIEYDDDGAAAGGWTSSAVSVSCRNL